ncbi:MAG: diacylglycerol kinase family protein [Candidatus Kerfeldbacteria bacterium]|nr:diacylglycerol kinase family protein [Candidatus Kerfeldbacteria bacterium]
MPFRRSLTFALKGLRYVYLHERNFRIHVWLAVAAVGLAALLRASATQWLFVTTAIASVLALEVINTVFEKMIDLIHPRVHHYAGTIKDLVAAAVLVASLSALIVGALVYVPLIRSRWL